MKKSIFSCFDGNPYWGYMAISGIATAFGLATKAIAEAYVKTHTPEPVKKEADMTDVVNKLDEILKKLNESAA